MSLTKGQSSILEALLGGDKTRNELALITGLKKTTLNQLGFLPTLCELNLIHICGWRRMPNHIVPIYRHGEGNNKKKPPPLTPSERTKRYVDSHTDVVNFSRRFRRAKKEGRSMSIQGKDPLLLLFGVFDKK